MDGLPRDSIVFINSKPQPSAAHAHGDGDNDNDDDDDDDRKMEYVTQLGNAQRVMIMAVA